MTKDEMNQDDMSDDAEFEAFLKGEGPLARALQAFDQPGPSARLDAAILADARATLAPPSQADAVTGGLTRSANNAAGSRSPTGVDDAPLLERAAKRMADGPATVAANGGATVLPLPRGGRAAAPNPEAPSAVAPVGTATSVAATSDLTAASAAPFALNEPAAALARDSAVLDSARAALARAQALQAANDAAPSAATGAARKHPMSLDWRWRIPAGIAATLLVGLVARESFESDKNGIGSDAGVTAERVVQDVARAPAAEALPPPPPPAPAAEAIASAPAAAPPPAVATPAPAASAPATEALAQAKRAPAGGGLVRTTRPTAAPDSPSARSARSTAPQAAPARREEKSARLDDVLMGEPAPAPGSASSPVAAPAPVAAADEAPRKPVSAPPMPAPAAPPATSAVPVPAPAPAPAPAADRPATANDAATAQPVTISGQRSRIDAGESVTPVRKTESAASNAVIAPRSAPARKKSAVFGVVSEYENARSTTPGAASAADGYHSGTRPDFSRAQSQYDGKIEPRQLAPTEATAAQTQTATAPEMLESIELLLEAGQYSAARTVWEALRTRYPTYPIPDITREKLQRRR